MAQSSAKRAVFSAADSLIFSLALSALVMSFMKILNNVSEITEPWGMPFIMSVLVEN